MAHKTWTATDIEQGKLILLPEKEEGITTIRAEQRYQFKDANGNILTQIVGGRVLEVKEWNNLPQNIKDALTTINNYMKQKALEQEGML